jgi:hypothetical protein
MGMTASRRICASFARSPHRPGQDIGGFDDMLNHGTAFGAVALEQLLITVTVQDKVEFPDQIPNVMQSGVHSLSAKGTMNVGGITGDEHTPYAQLRNLSVMDAKIAAPVQGACL